MINRAWCLWIILQSTGRTQDPPNPSLKQLEAISWFDLLGQEGKAGKKGRRRKGPKSGKKQRHAVLERIIAQGQPVLLRDSPATQW